MTPSTPMPDTMKGRETEKDDAVKGRVRLRAKIGVEPYEDGSGFRFEIEADQNKGAPRVSIKTHGDEIYIEPHQWMALKKAVEEAFDFLEDDADAALSRQEAQG